MAGDGGHAGGGSGDSRPLPVEGQAAAVAKRERTGKIYITVTARTRGTGAIIRWLMALDPKTGARADVFDGCSMRPRVSPDGKLVAFERENALWVRGLDPNAEPRKVIELGGPNFRVAARSGRRMGSRSSSVSPVARSLTGSSRPCGSTSTARAGRNWRSLPKTTSRIGPPTADGS